MYYLTAFAAHDQSYSRGDISTSPPSSYSVETKGQTRIVHDISATQNNSISTHICTVSPPSMSIKKVILIGNSGCGKTSFFQYATGSDVSLKPQRTLQCQQDFLRGRSDIVIIDTPGLESNDDEWWDSISQHQNINYGNLSYIFSINVISNPNV